MSATSIPVARLLQLEMPIAWQEAVEVARAADAAATAAGTPILLEECMISTDGTLRVVAMPGVRHGSPFTVLGLLSLMLKGQSAPPELKALVATGGDALSGFPTEQGTEPTPEFNLDWFASPRPELEIARLAARAIEAAGHHDVDSALQRLRTAVTAPALDRPAAQVVPATPAPPMPRPLDLQPFVRPLAIGAAVVVLVGGGLIARALFTRTTAEAAVSATETLPETPPPVTAATETAATETAPVEGAVATPKRAPTSVPAIVTNPPAGATASATRASAARPAGGASAVPRAAAVASSVPAALTVSPAAPVISPSTLPEAVPPPVFAPEPAPAPAPAPPPALAAPSPAPAAASPTVEAPARNSDVVEVPPFRPAPASVAAPASVRLYSLQDEDVEPPVFLRPQLPADFKPDSEQSASYIEVTVDERGQVAQVRLRSTDASLNDRMIVAAAKAWQFRPAVKDGRPVPYVLTVPVTR